jgi:hypothetical protein
MHKLNPFGAMPLDKALREYCSSRVRPCKSTQGRDGKLYIIFCARDDGQVTVCAFDDEEDLHATVDQAIEEMLDYSRNDEENPEDWIYDAVDNAVYSNRVARVYLWG